MTDAQFKVQCKQTSADVGYKLRAFRKKCVTQRIVEFVRRDGYHYYEVKYRGCFVCTLFHDEGEYLKLLAVWNTVSIAEQLLKAERFVRESKESKNESN